MRNVRNFNLTEDRCLFIHTDNIRETTLNSHGRISHFTFRFSLVEEYDEVWIGARKRV